MTGNCIYPIRACNDMPLYLRVYTGIVCQRPMACLGDSKDDEKDQVKDVPGNAIGDVMMLIPG